MSWKEGGFVQPSRFAVSLSNGSGVLPLSPADLARLYPDLWKTPAAVKQTLKRVNGYKRLLDSLIGECPHLKLVAVTYRRRGARGKPSIAIIDASIADPQAALEGLVGPIVDLRIGHEGSCSN